MTNVKKLSHFNITVLNVIKLMHYMNKILRGVLEYVTLLYDRVSLTEFYRSYPVV